MRPFRTTRVLLVPLAALTLLLAACGADDADPDQESVIEQAPGTNSPRDTDAPGKDKGGTAGERTADPPSSSGAGCLEGTWLTDPDSVASIAIATSGLGHLAPQVTVSGDALVTFADGTVRTEYLDQVAEMVVTVEGQVIRSTGRSDGVLTGSYTATDTEMTTRDVDTSGLTMETTASIDGVPMDMGDIDAMSLSAMTIDSTSAYTCTATELRMTPAVAGLDTSAFVTVLHRQ